tara:strand:+ start:86 stop:301 length:216 start_codon:yes stop_codon:yes gene_type:complete
MLHFAAHEQEYVHDGNTTPCFWLGKRPITEHFLFWGAINPLALPAFLLPPQLRIFTSLETPLARPCCVGII